jgi:hypothetical protein
LDREGVTVEDLLAKQAIHDALMRYCRGIDRCDAELVRSAYHPDSFDDHGAYKGNGWEFADVVVEGLAMFASTQHAICNEFVELDGDVGYAESYFVASHRLDQEGVLVDLVFAGRYVDRFELRAGDWKIAHRVVVHDWSRIDRVEEVFPGLDVFEQGKRGHDDIVFRSRQPTTH